MRSPYSNSFLEVVSNPASGTDPSTSPWGVTVTPGENTYGSYVEVIGSVAGTTLGSDAYVIEVTASEGNTSANARDMLLTLGFDESGGTTYTDWTIDHLLVSCADNRFGTGSSGPITYRFPVRVKSGASIAAKASVNNATAGTVNVAVRLYTKPTHPELIRVGSFVRTFGETTASSSGTAVTAGTTSEGTWTQLGTALAEPLWYWEVGVGVNDSSMTNAALHADIGIGDASNKKVAVHDAFFLHGSTERQSKRPAGAYMDAAVGDIVYGRIQATSSAATDLSMIAYGVG